MKNTKYQAAKDPNLSREAEKYERPVPSREYILQVLKDAKAELFLEDFIDLFVIDDDSGKEGVRRRLRAMVRDAQLVCNQEGAYRPFIEGKDRAPPPYVIRPRQEEFVNRDLAVNAAIKHHHLPHEWSDEVLEEIKQFDIDIPAEEIQNRQDLRALPFVTIDGEDARDFDDAVYCEPLKNGQFKLMVAIADVSFYVRPGTDLDNEAYTRGTSIYFPGRVIPMLPEILSNELCSLKPNVDRLSMVADMLISKEGQLVSYSFYPAVIRSQARLTYNQVAKALEAQDVAEIGPHVFKLYDLYKILLASRQERGALDFDTIEGVLILDEKGELAEIKSTPRNDAHRLIEEMMLMANVAAADFFIKHEALGIYRIHEGVRIEKFEDLRDFLKVRSIPLGKAPPTVKELNAVLAAAQKREDYPIIQTVVLRSLNQAIYSADNVGHYGLAYAGYTHFTSPIRRYPDLLVHRLIRAILDQQDHSGAQYAEEDLRAMCIHASHTERQADEASREVSSTLKCGLVKRHLGATFSGIISAVTGFGMFVTIDDLLIDGLIHISSLPSDFYQFDAPHHRLVGERSGRIFQLGQAVKIRVVKVNVWERKVDFVLA
ncbi:MAG: ribonuclease R [Gammaproteobacteria bacterium]|nr:ribonuclease R [Gammaproteobacteria bacterium]